MLATPDLDLRYRGQLRSTWWSISAPDDAALAYAYNPVQVKFTAIRLASSLVGWARQNARRDHVTSVPSAHLVSWPRQGRHVPKEACPKGGMSRSASSISGGFRARAPLPPERVSTMAPLIPINAQMHLEVHFVSLFQCAAFRSAVFPVRRCANVICRLLL